VVVAGALARRALKPDTAAVDMAGPAVVDMAGEVGVDTVGSVVVVIAAADMALDTAPVGMDQILDLAEGTELLLVVVGMGLREVAEVVAAETGGVRGRRRTLWRGRGNPP